MAHMDSLCRAQGEATAALAEIASRNKAHLPEAPLEDAAAGPPVRPLGDILGNARLRRRMALLLTLWPLAWALFLGLTMLIAQRIPGRAALNLLVCFAADGVAVILAAPLMERLGRCSVCSAMLMLGEAQLLASARACACTLGHCKCMSQTLMQQHEYPKAEAHTERRAGASVEVKQVVLPAVTCDAAWLSMHEPDRQATCGSRMSQAAPGCSRAEHGVCAGMQAASPACCVPSLGAGCSTYQPLLARWAQPLLSACCTAVRPTCSPPPCEWRRCTLVLWCCPCSRRAFLAADLTVTDQAVTLQPSPSRCLHARRVPCRA